MRPGWLKKRTVAFGYDPLLGTTLRCARNYLPHLNRQRYQRGQYPHLDSFWLGLRTCALVLAHHLLQALLASDFHYYVSWHLIPPDKVSGPHRPTIDLWVPRLLSRYQFYCFTPHSHGDIACPLCKTTIMKQRWERLQVCFVPETESTFSMPQKPKK